VYNVGLHVQYVYPIANSEIAGAYESTFEGTKVLSKVRKYIVLSYFRTFVRKYFRKSLQVLYNCRLYFRTKVPKVVVLSYFRKYFRK
jgi:hypothetical protein